MGLKATFVIFDADGGSDSSDVWCDSFVHEFFPDSEMHQFIFVNGRLEEDPADPDCESIERLFLSKKFFASLGVIRLPEPKASIPVSELEALKAALAQASEASAHTYTYDEIMDMIHQTKALMETVAKASEASKAAVAEDAEVQKLAQEAEAGYDLAKLTPQPPKMQFFSDIPPINLDPPKAD